MSESQCARIVERLCRINVLYAIFNGHSMYWDWDRFRNRKGIPNGNPAIWTRWTKRMDVRSARAVEDEVHFARITFEDPWLCIGTTARIQTMSEIIDLLEQVDFVEPDRMIGFVEAYAGHDVQQVAYVDRVDRVGILSDGRHVIPCQWIRSRVAHEGKA